MPDKVSLSLTLHILAAAQLYKPSVSLGLTPLTHGCVNSNRLDVAAAELRRHLKVITECTCEQ